MTLKDLADHHYGGRFVFCAGSFVGRVSYVLECFNANKDEEYLVSCNHKGMNVVIEASGSMAVKIVG